MKKIFLVYGLLVIIYLTYFGYYKYTSATNSEWTSSGVNGSINEKYVMVTFQSGMDYWKNCFKGFEDSANLLNVSVEYRGAMQRDVHEETTVMEQVISEHPSGIAVSAINSEALKNVIDKAVQDGIPVVTFDSGATGSKAYSFLGTNNYNAGEIAADKLAELIKGKGNVAVITLPNQQNHKDRTSGFVDEIKSDYPNIHVVAIENGKGDQLASKEAAIKVLKKYPDLSGIFATEANGGLGIAEAKKDMGSNTHVKIISFDTDKGILDMVKNGTISATLSQGTWEMGYWALQFLFQIKHGLIKSSSNESISMTSVPPNVDTGITVVTKKNVDKFYSK
ncbi:substrate-binding domain-containing protein [Pullulanibacillus sp. KACC 23026]|uniref:substrate-binding domain-containing protein n=1 Tax=Pullulanibacillus sp. KACC 23026 TaxID=3028315 RepID=UPI0023AFEE4D|nr:substrate-binding domain-containing protein [Pullulanibacillus sp. KACC 23026]WEG12496.1 substrate-binding domain-containing protein [Pullulanibacillus sp. KACC 23026]